MLAPWPSGSWRRSRLLLFPGRAERPPPGHVPGGGRRAHFLFAAAYPEKSFRIRIRTTVPLKPADSSGGRPLPLSDPRARPVRNGCRRGVGLLSVTASRGGPELFRKRPYMNLMLN